MLPLRLNLLEKGAAMIPLERSRLRKKTKQNLLSFGFVQNNRQTLSDKSMMLKMFRTAYFLFSNEIAHTTTWRRLLSTMSTVDSSGQLKTFVQKAAANAHHLSSTSITDIMQCYGEAMVETSVTELSGVSDFAILADECTDVNGKEMLSICCRYLH